MQNGEDKLTCSKEFVKDDKFELSNNKFSKLEVNSTKLDLKVTDTKKIDVSDIVDVEVLNVEDLKTKAKKTKTDVDMLSSMRLEKWWHKWEWENSESPEIDYASDECYCPVCLGTCKCIPRKCNCSRN